MESAKRRVPLVKPVEHQGVRFEAMRRAREQGFLQSGGVVAAVDIASGKTLWTRQLYEIKFDANEERDVQEVYLTELRYDSKLAAVIATDELKRKWRLNAADGVAAALPPMQKH